MEPVCVEQFEELVADALDSLPAELARHFANVVVLVEDEEPGQPSVLGRYVGVDLTRRAAGYGGVLPDRISLYRLPLCRACPDVDALAREVRVTVVHEFAHHMGMDEERLHALGWG